MTECCNATGSCCTCKNVTWGQQSCVQCITTSGVHARVVGCVLCNEMRLSLDEQLGTLSFVLGYLKTCHALGQILCRRYTLGSINLGLLGRRLNRGLRCRR